MLAAGGDCLRRYPLFDLLEAEQLDTWLQAAEEVTVPTGETVFQVGAAATWVYLILEGHVRAVHRASSGREVTLGRIGPGEVFGEYALLPPHRYTAGCRAVSDARLLCFPLAILQAMLAALPDVAADLKNWLCLDGLLAYLRQQAFLGFMSAPSALRFLDRLRPVEFQAGQTIQADGLGDDCWYFIETGAVSLNAADSAGNQAPRELGPGDCFGARALLGREGLPVAVARSDTRCLGLAREHFSPEHHHSNSLQSRQAQMSTWRREFVWVGQQEASDCGLAALVMIARFFRQDVSVPGLRQVCQIGDEGMSLVGLQEAASGLGLRCLAVQVRGEQFHQVAVPAIVHLDGGHYVVLYKFDPTEVIIGDPAVGIVRMSHDLFARSCSGKVLLVRPPPPSASLDTHLLMQRYGGMIHRYLLRVCDSPSTADDLLQEIGLALASSSVGAADPERGRWRCLVKSVLFHLLSKHGKRQKLANPAVPPEQMKRDFDDYWRDEFLARTWEVLHQEQPLMHEVLRFQAEGPRMGWPDMAEALSRQRNQPLTPDAVRQTSQRAREKFAALLLDEVTRSLEGSMRERLEEELSTLNLLDYCKPALPRVGG